MKNPVWGESHEKKCYDRPGEHFSFVTSCCMTCRTLFLALCVAAVHAQIPDSPPDIPDGDARRQLDELIHHGPKVLEGTLLFRTGAVFNY